MKKMFTCFLLLLPMVSPLLAQDVFRRHETKASEVKTSISPKLQLESLAGQGWNSSTNELTDNFKSVYTYDAAGNTIMQMDYNWDVKAAQWIKNFKIEYVFNEAGQKITDTDATWDSNTNAWIYLSKREFEYDITNGNVLEISWIWNKAEQKWTNSNKTENVYDASGKLLTELHYNLFTDKWELTRKTEHTNDINGNEILKAFYHLGTDNTSWILSDKSKTDYTYDENKNILTAMTAEWDGADWLYEGKSIYTYDLQVNSADIIWPLGNAYKNKLLYVTDYNENVNHEWIKTGMVTFAYSDFTTDIKDEALIESVSVCPNPAHTSITCKFPAQIEQAALTVYDQQGKVVIEQQVDHNTSLPVANLSGGLYLYIFSAGQNIYKGKFVIE